MALTATVTRSITFSAGQEIGVDDLHTLGEPVVSIAGSVGTSDLEAGSITFAKLSANFVLGGTNVVTSIEGTDMVLIGDDSADANAVITFSNVWSGVQTLGTVATSFNSYTNDTITWYRANTSAAQKTTIAYFAESLVNGAPLMTDPTAEADGILITDASASPGAKAKLVAIGDLLPPVITAGTYAQPLTLTLRADGRVSAITTTGRGTRTSSTVESTQYSLPTGAGSANATQIAHGLGSTPLGWTVKLVCTDAAGDAGYAQNDVIGIQAAVFDTGASDVNAPYVILADATYLQIIRPAIGSGSNGIIPHKSTGADATFTPTKWKVFASAFI